MATGGDLSALVQRPRPRRSQSFFSTAATRSNSASFCSHQPTGRTLTGVTLSSSGALDESLVSLLLIARRQDLDLLADRAGATLSMSFDWAAKRVASGFNKTAIKEAPGTSSRRSPNRFPSRASASRVTPVTLPPGRSTPATRPSSTGSRPGQKNDWESSRSRPLPPMLTGRRPLPRSRPPGGEIELGSPCQAAGRIDAPPNDIQ